MTNIAFETKADVPTRRGVISIVEFVASRTGWVISADDLAALCDPALGSSKPRNWEYLAEFAIEVLNEDAPIGTWYTLTADFNIAVDIDEEVYGS